MEITASTVRFWLVN